MSTSWIARKQRFNLGFLAGLAAGIIASALMLLLSVTLNGISLPEVFGSAFTQVLPPSAFNYLHRTIGGDAKHYLFYGILVGQCLVFALSGGLSNLFFASERFSKRSSTPGQLNWLTGVILALVLWLLVGLVFLPLTGAGLFGANLAIGVLSAALSLAVVGLIFGLLFIYIQNWLVLRRWQAQEKVIDQHMLAAQHTRRVILQRGLIALGVGTLGVAAWRFITAGAGAGSAAVGQLAQQFKSKITPPPVPNYGNVVQVPHLSTEITPNDQYYIVSKNLFSDPAVDGATWHLKVDGEVAQPFTMTYNELTALPMKKQYESMMCVSNEVGGEYMSSAAWEGVPLADLIQRAGGAKSGAVKVVLYAADDYSDSIVLSKALETTTLVAVRMNGETLPQGHGYPARLLVPGIYGMKHVKWINRIQVVKTDYQGYWQQRGWSDPAPVRLTARIDTPLALGTVAANKLSYIGGVAFSGNKGISQVDVSVDAGKTWQRATLKQPLSSLTWVVWELPWTPKAGSYTILARAIDLQGNVQNPEVDPPLPNGSSGYHTIDVTVQ